jgi:hypothetical protein
MTYLCTAAGQHESSATSTSDCGDDIPYLETLPAWGIRGLVIDGVIPAGSLHPLTARLLLSMLVATGADSATVRSEFLARA